MRRLNWLSEAKDKAIRCWGRWDRGLVTFLTRFAWIIIGVHLFVAGLASYSWLSRPPLYSVEERIYEYQRDNSESEDREPISISAEDQSTDVGSQEQNTASGDDSTEKDLQEYIRSARDLNAQEGMWRAAYFLAVLTAIQVVFGVLALWFIYDTLLATRSTLDETRKATRAAIRTTESTVSTLEITKNANRGLILATNVKHDLVNRIGKPEHRLLFTIKNIGSGVAVSRSLIVGAKNTRGTADFFVDSASDVTATLQKIDVFPGANAEHKRSHTLSLTRAPYSIEANKYFAWCIIEYTDGFGSRWRSTSTFHSTTSNSSEIEFSKTDFVESQICKAV